MKNLFYILILLFFSSCSDVEDNFNDYTSVDLNTVSSSSTIKFDNPLVFVGSDFGTFFKTLYRHGKFDDMLAFTSSISIEEFGVDRIMYFYENDLDFSYDINLNSHNLLGDTIVLNYDAQIYATNKVVRVMVVVENDSCKIVLPNNFENFPS